MAGGAGDIEVGGGQPAYQRVRAGDGIDGGAGDAVGQEHGNQWQQPQHRAAVGEQQQHGDDGDRDQQQGGVEVTERVGGIDHEPGGPGDLDLEPRRRVGADLPADVDDCIVGGVLVAAVQRQAQQQGLAVGGRHRRLDPMVGDQPGQHSPVRGGLGVVGVGQAARTRVHHHRGELLAAWEPGRQLTGLGRLGGAWHPRRDVVLVDVADLTGQRTGGGAQRQPGDNH